MLADNDSVKVLGEKKESYNGDFVLQGQTVAKDSGFSHVSKIWFDKCITFEKGIEKVTEDQKVIEDIRGPMCEWEPVVSENKFAMRHKPSDRHFFPTTTALKHMAITGRMSDWQLNALTEPVLHQSTIDKKTGEKKVVWNRDSRDAEVLKEIVRIHLFEADRFDQSKERLFRTWTDGTLRAFLSDQYAIVNNLWVMEVLQKLIPGGMLSHWRGDADAIYGNVLIPDTIRADSDSDYGGMLSVGNSEIGTRRVYTLPSVFRAICMNGCIWDQETGKAVNKKHRGELDLIALEAMIKENLEAQIPLLSDGIQRVLGLKAYGVGDMPLRNAFAQLAKDYPLGKSNVLGIIKAFGEETAILGKEARTAFGLMAAVTRYGQKLDNDEWFAYDKIGGELSMMTADHWDGFKNRAKALRDKDVEKVLGEELAAAAA